MHTSNKENEMTALSKTNQATNVEIEDASWKSLYKVGGIAALAIVVIALIQAPIFILYPQPVTVIGHFAQFQDNKLLGLVDLDLILILAEACMVPVLFALYAALRRFNPALMTIAMIFGLGGIALFFAVNPTFSFIYLSDQYAMATTDIQRAAYLSAGEALIANYNGTAFGLFFILGGVADLIIAFVMLRSGVFSKATAFTGMVVGAMLLVPPLPFLGMFALALSYIVILPSMIWTILIAIRLFNLGRSNPNQDKSR
jgi:hypothetical protein